MTDLVMCLRCRGEGSFGDHGGPDSEIVCSECDGGCEVDRDTIVSNEQITEIVGYIAQLDELRNPGECHLKIFSDWSLALEIDKEWAANVDGIYTNGAWVIDRLIQEIKLSGGDVF